MVITIFAGAGLLSLSGIDVGLISWMVWKAQGLAEALVLSKFRLIWIDRFGYSDNGESMISSLIAIGAKDILPGMNPRYVVLDLFDVAVRLQRKLGAEEFARRQETLLEAPNNFRWPQTEFTAILPKTLKEVQETIGGSYGLDKINGGTVDSIVKSDGLIIEGWAIDRELNLVSEIIYVRLKPNEGPPFYAKAQRGQRLDVAAHFNNNVFNNSGFTLDAVIDNLPEGTYKIDVLQKEPDRVLVSDLHKTLRIINKEGD